MEDLFKPKFVNLPYKPEEVKPISLEAVSGYFDASPVRILYGGIQSNIREKVETIVYEAAVNMGVDVDKEKLLHALAYDRMQYYEGFRAGERAAQPKWISVEERLPEISDLVLVIANGKPCEHTTLVNAVLIASYWGDEGWIADGFDGWDKLVVTHWMPLPPGPEEG